VFQDPIHQSTYVINSMSFLVLFTSGSLPKRPMRVNLARSEALVVVEKPYEIASVMDVRRADRTTYTVSPTSRCSRTDSGEHVEENMPENWLMRVILSKT